MTDMTASDDEALAEFEVWWDALSRAISFSQALRMNPKDYATAAWTAARSPQGGAGDDAKDARIEALEDALDVLGNWPAHDHPIFNWDEYSNVRFFASRALAGKPVKLSEEMGAIARSDIAASHAQGRRQGLEEAAKTVEHAVMSDLPDARFQDDWNFCIQSVSADIRALIDREDMP